jgi:hypothetical protein
MSTVSNTTASHLSILNAFLAVFDRLDGTKTDHIGNEPLNLLAEDAESLSVEFLEEALSHPDLTKEASLLLEPAPRFTSWQNPEMKVGPRLATDYRAHCRDVADSLQLSEIEFRAVMAGKSYWSADQLHDMYEAQQRELQRKRTQQRKPAMSTPRRFPKKPSPVLPAHMGEGATLAQHLSK